MRVGKRGSKYLLQNGVPAKLKVGTVNWLLKSKEVVWGGRRERREPESFLINIKMNAATKIYSG